MFWKHQPPKSSHEPGIATTVFNTHKNQAPSPVGRKRVPEISNYGCKISSYLSSSFRYLAVIDRRDLATISGVPHATSSPPPRPPSGPMSIM